MFLRVHSESLLHIIGQHFLVLHVKLISERITHDLTHNKPTIGPLSPEHLPRYWTSCTPSKGFQNVHTFLGTTFSEVLARAPSPPSAMLLQYQVLVYFLPLRDQMILLQISRPCTTSNLGVLYLMPRSQIAVVHSKATSIATAVLSAITTTVSNSLQKVKPA